MTASPDLDRLLRTYLRDGPTELPDASFDAIRDRIEQTRQRVVLGPWRLPEMNKIVAFGVATAAVVIAAVIGVQVLSGQNVMGPPSPSPSLESPAARFSPRDLPTLVLAAGPWNITSSTYLQGLDVDSHLFGRDALDEGLPPGSAGFDESAFVDARMTNLGSTETGGYVSWAVLFETAADADLAYQFIVDEHLSATGWGMDVEGVGLFTGESPILVGPAYGWESATVWIWQEDGLVLAAIGVGEHDPAVVEAIALEMDRRIGER